MRRYRVEIDRFPINSIFAPHSLEPPTAVPFLSYHNVRTPVPHSSALTDSAAPPPLALEYTRNRMR